MAARKKPPARPKEDQRAAVEPSVRTFTTWTPALLRSAEASADTGNLRSAANLVDWIQTDDRVQGCLHTRVQSLLGLDPSFEKSGDKRRSSRVVNALEAQEDWWASYPETDIGLMVTWGLTLGVVPMRHRWLEVPGHNGRILPLPEFWHPQHLRFDWQTREWKIRVQSGPGASAGVEETITPGDGTWILHAPYGTHRPWSLGMWRGLARMVLLKAYAIQDWARHSEKSALLVATSDKDTRSTLTERAQLADDIYDRGREAVCALPPGFDLKLVASEANSYQLYEKQIEMANAAIAIQTRGGNLTTETAGGSRAAAETQERLGDEVKRRFDGQSLTTTLHDQSLFYWAEFNFGDGMLAPWPVYPTGPKKDSKSKADAITAAAGAGKALVDLGLEIDSQGFIDEFEMNGFVKPGASKVLVMPVKETAPSVKPASPAEPKPEPKELPEAAE